MGGRTPEARSVRLGPRALRDPDAEHACVRRDLGHARVAGLHRFAQAFLAASGLVRLLCDPNVRPHPADDRVPARVHHVHGSRHLPGPAEGRPQGHRFVFRVDAGAHRAGLQRRARLQLRGRCVAVHDPAAQRSPSSGMAPVAGGGELQPQLRAGPGVDRLVRRHRPDRARPRHRRLSLPSARRGEVSHRPARAAEPGPHAVVDGALHDDQPLDPGPTHHQGVVSAKRPVRRATPLRKPVAGTPAGVMPVAVVAGIAVLIAAFWVIHWYTTPLPPKPLSQDTTTVVVSMMTGLPASEFDAVGQGTANNLIKPVSGTKLLGSTGKPEVFYLGAEYCPFCAAERWPLIIALSRFGTFSGLETTTSSSSDIFPNTQTFTFRNAKYTSQYIDFVSVDTPAPDQNALQSPTAAEQQLVKQFDTSGSIPFIDFGNQYASTGATYSPDAIGGMSWRAIADALKQPDSTQAKAIVGSANLITAAICKITADQPAAVCSSATIQNLEKTLK